MSNVKCPRCNGTGTITLPPKPEYPNARIKTAYCNVCFGKGKISKDKLYRIKHPSGPFAWAEYNFPPVMIPDVE